jgi:ABC-type bacteriocin/lantibiotic exporter with double-glycine peptidase domain
MKLLLGFERPEAGGIFLDGHDLRTLDVQAVRRQVGVVLQSGRVMPGSIYENIKGAVDATVDDAWEAARMSGLEDDIRAMPMGMHTMLTEGSAALSGGQVQRMLIARAVVSKPRLLLFDEATSALDNRTQAIVTKSLSKLSVTRIAIAHRLSTVRDADRIYVLKDGRVIEAGSYDELMAKNGLFSELARRQLT